MGVTTKRWGWHSKWKEYTLCLNVKNESLEIHQRHTGTMKNKRVKKAQRVMFHHLSIQVNYHAEEGWQSSKFFI